MERPLRPVLAGNSLAGVFVLELLLEEWSAGDILVIAPASGVRHDWQPSLADAAEAHGVRVMTPEDVNASDVVDALRSHSADLLLSVYYTQVFRAAVLGAVQGPALNFHPSLLPRHRGTAPLIRAIAEGDTTVGVSVHDITLGIDTGPLRWQRVLAVHRDDTGYTLHLKASNLVRGIAADLLRRLTLGLPLPDPVEQSGHASVHTSRDPQLNRIDWHQPADTIRNVVRALAHPLPGAYSTWSGRRIGIERVEPVATSRPARTPGMVEFGIDGEILVWAGGGPVRLETVRLEGRVTGSEHLLGEGLLEGEIFS